MAFGKAKVNNMNLRQSMRRGTKRGSSGGGGGRSAPFYVNKYQPPVKGPADIIRLIPGQFPTQRIDHDNKDFARSPDGEPVVDNLPYYKYISYFHATKQKSLIGSEGPLGEFKGKAAPCIAADWFWWEWRQRQASGNKDHPKSISRSEKFALTVLVQAPFYQVPQVDKNTGAVRVNENTKEPYYDLKQGSVRGNDEYAAAGYKKKDGHRQHWSLSYGHWQVLNDFSDGLARHCRACGGHDCIEEVALLCQNCGEAIVIMAETSLSDEDLTRLRNEEVQCPNCKHMGYLEDAIQCTQCDHGEPATIFDFDLEVKRTPTANSENSQQTTLNILRAIGPRPIDSKYGEDLRKALNLPKIFTPTPLDVQRKMFGDPPSDDDAPPQRSPVNNSSRASYENGEDESETESE